MVQCIPSAWRPAHPFTQWLSEWQLHLNKNRSPFTPLLRWRRGNRFPSTLIGLSRSFCFCPERPVVPVKVFFFLCLTLHTPEYHTHSQPQPFCPSKGAFLRNPCPEDIYQLRACVSTICFLYFTYKDLDKESETLLCFGWSVQMQVMCRSCWYYLLPCQFWVCKSCLYPVIPFICVFCPSSLIWQCHVVLFIWEASYLSVLWCSRLDFSFNVSYDSKFFHFWICKEFKGFHIVS